MLRKISPTRLTRIVRKYSGCKAAAKICVVGAGPAGFYAAQRLLKLLPGAAVDIYEKLPVPFGLVRYGVAPDHPEVKNVINTFTKTAKDPLVNFFGNVTLGKDICLEDLQNSYHAVLLTYGAEEDKKLNIPGEDLRNVLSARQFVGWYNGVPQDRNLIPNLDVENVVVIGQGNVAIDVARILLSSVDKLKETDITQYSLEQLSKSKVKKVSLIGRRGPLQVAFTIKEFREMLNLPGVKTVFNKSDFEGISKIIPDLERPRKRLTELLYKSAMEGSRGEMCDKTFEVIFKRTPFQFTGGESVGEIEMGINILSGNDWKSQEALVTEERAKLPCGLALRSIGYRSLQVEPSIPFDSCKGIAISDRGKIAPGLYCCGWLSTGPLGVILSTMTNAFNVAQTIFNDINDKVVNVDNAKCGSSHILQIMSRKGIQVVRFEDWEKIDKEEERRGKALGKKREKIVSIDEMLSIAR